MGTAFLNKCHFSGSDGSQADTTAIQPFTKADKPERYPVPRPKKEWLQLRSTTRFHDIHMKILHSTVVFMISGLWRNVRYQIRIELSEKQIWYKTLRYFAEYQKSMNGVYTAVSTNCKRFPSK
jgi:hypothetical protein